MDFFTKDGEVRPINEGSGISSSQVLKVGNATTTELPKKIHDDRLENFKNMRNKKHQEQKKSVFFHLGKTVGTLENKKRMHDEDKKLQKNILDARIDRLIDNEHVSDEQKLRRLQRMHFELRKRLTEDQKHTIREEIQKLRNRIENDSGSKMTKDEFKEEQQKERLEHKVQRDKNPAPVTFGSNIDDEEIAEQQTDSDMEDDDLEQKHKEPKGLSEKIVKEQIVKELKN